MTERMNGLKRTDMCGTLSKRDEDREVIVTGFAAKTRDLGNLLFIDLRDRTGILQLAFDDETPRELFAKARGVRSEYVLCARGRVRLRTGKNVNPAMATGEVEIAVAELRILSEAEVTPFVISEKASVSETLALKYRYLDLRKPVFQRNLIMRDRICRAVRSYYAENGFLEIETPCLGKSTPEGARDYLVPSRVKPGTFYALPQSPQLYKQLLMIAGMDRYYQIARCFRDEDLRANRQPEFTQIDVEMSYVERDEDVMEIAEGMIKRIFKECRGISFDAPFRRMKWREAMDRFGSDKPDTRYGLEIRDLSPCVKDSSFVLFSRALERGTVRGICVPGAASRFSRKEMDAFSDFASDYGVSRILWTAKREDADASSFYKNLTPEEIQAIEKTLGAGKGDLILVAADAGTNSVLCALGALRRKLADALRLYDKSVYDVLWITDFPLLEWNDEDNRFYAQHHPFTSVHADDMDKLDSKDRDVLAGIRANAYDIVINGQEAGGGSIRIHTPEMQRKMFSLLGLDDETVKNRFGFFLEAFRYGTPPHGGIAFGLDRLVMLLTGDENIKDVIAFPKVQNASDLMTGAPDAVEESQLKELDITLAER